jgi:hypothetical protein
MEWREHKEKGEGGRIWQKYYVSMHENGTMTPAETFLRRGGEEKDGGGESN